MAIYVLCQWCKGKGKVEKKILGLRIRVACKKCKGEGRVPETLLPK